MLVDVVKALFYTCNSYPKIAAPHRLSPSDDFEVCIVSSIISSIKLYDHVLRIILELKRGERSIGELEIGKTFAKSLTACFQELKHKISFEMCLTAPILLYLDTLHSEIEKDFHKVLRRFFNAMQVQDVEDLIEFIKVARSVGGKLSALLDKAGITEHRVTIEGLTLYNLFEELSNYDAFFNSLINFQKIVEVVRLSEKLYNEFNDLNKTLSKLFLELAKDKISLESDKLLDILKLDIDYRKKGLNLLHLMPYISYAALYIIKYL